MMMWSKKFIPRMFAVSRNCSVTFLSSCFSLSNQNDCGDQYTWQHFTIHDAFNYFSLIHQHFLCFYDLEFPGQHVSYSWPVGYSEFVEKYIQL